MSGMSRGMGGENPQMMGNTFEQLKEIMKKSIHYKIINYFNDFLVPAHEKIIEGRLGMCCIVTDELINLFNSFKQHLDALYSLVDEVCRVERDVIHGNDDQVYTVLIPPTHSFLELESNHSLSPIQTDDGQYIAEFEQEPIDILPWHSPF